MLGHVLLIVFVTTVCADSVTPRPSPYSDRIIGGENADIQNYPYQASIQEFGHHSCGGSIISENYVLSAGHCFNSDRPMTTWMSVRVGSSYHGRGGRIHRVDKVIRHENYGISEYDTPFNDVAVVKVTTPFVFCDTIKPIKLFRSHEFSFIGAKSIVTGWGKTDNVDVPDQLQSVILPIISKHVCKKAYKKNGIVAKGQICAGFYGIGGKDACYGDSGGPLAINGRLAGIVSWGIGCADPRFPGVYTEVSYFRKWINKHAELK